jgi:chaperonin GroES
MKKTQETSSTSKEVPKHKDALKEKYIEESLKLPLPTGWRILVLPFKGKKKTKGGIYYSDEQIERQQLATVCGNVLAMGPDCYKDNEKFPRGPWCKKGDWVIFARYAGSRFKIEGGEVRLLNDDEIIATIKDPEDIVHEF